MTLFNRHLRKFFRMLIVCGLILSATGIRQVAPVWAHGGESHGENAFTALKAFQKGVTLYDRLIAEGRIEESWETDLQSASVAVGKNGEKQEYVIRFNRSSGEPASVYFFFTMEGEYSGSNFTGE